MSEAGWGTDKPTVAGWYWWKWDEFKHSPKCLFVDISETDGGYWTPCQFALQGGEWLGPITPDAYAAGRVAGLLEAGDAYPKWLDNPQYRTDWDGFDAWCRWRAEKLEAQAQGGAIDV